MSRHPRRIVLLVVLAAGVTLPAGAQERKAAPAPRLVSVAETKLIMEGMTLPNHTGIGRRLEKKPADVETWGFVRGQALLVAESGNLLMLRPPKNKGQDAWMRQATDLRESGVEVARQAASRDYDKTRAAFGDLTNRCNRCHQTFQVPVRIGPAADDDRKP